MFDDLRPDEVPVPAPGAVHEAMRRGTGIRRRRRAAWASGMAAVAVLVVGVLLGSPFSSNDSASVVPATATPTPPSDYSPIPATPTAADGVSFGFLDKITQSPDGSVTMRIQPGYFLSAEEAKAANGGEYPIGDVDYGVLEDLEPADFRVDPRAPLEGCCSLLSTAELDPEDATVRKRITLTGLVQNFAATAAGQIDGEVRALVWFRLSEDRTTITALAEQYTP